MRIMVQKNTNDTATNANLHTNEMDVNIGTKIKTEYGIDINMLSADLKNQLIRAYCKKRIADSELERIVSDINKAKRDRDIETQAMELIVSTIFIPIIDPEFETRSKKLQQEIFDIVFEFYAIATSGLTDDINSLLLITKRMINSAIQRNSQSQNENFDTYYKGTNKMSSKISKREVRKQKQKPKESFLLPLDKVIKSILAFALVIWGSYHLIQWIGSIV